MILLEEGVNAYIAGIDMTIVATFAGMERMESQWGKIL
jgi:hypothetical protein